MGATRRHQSEILLIVNCGFCLFSLPFLLLENSPKKFSCLLTKKRDFHDKRAQTESTEMHQTEGGFLKPLIFGGLDGILTSFAIVAGAAGGSMPVPVILVLGFSNIFADALAMGVGEFLSSKAENEWILSERRRENWEMENYPEGEIQEMIDIYEQRGMTHEDAKMVIETMAKYKDFFVDVMMVRETWKTLAICPVQFINILTLPCV